VFYKNIENRKTKNTAQYFVKQEKRRIFAVSKEE